MRSVESAPDGNRGAFFCDIAILVIRHAGRFSGGQLYTHKTPKNDNWSGSRFAISQRSLRGVRGVWRRRDALWPSPWTMKREETEIGANREGGGKGPKAKRGAKGEQESRKKANCDGRRKK
jgi:hypothetical protein